MAISKELALRVGKGTADPVLRFLSYLARILGLARALVIRLVAQGGGRPDILDTEGDDATIVDPAPAWRAEAEPRANARAMNGTAPRGRRASSQELFEQIMREIASSPTGQHGHVKRLRAGLNGGTAGRS